MHAKRPNWRIPSAMGEAVDESIVHDARSRKERLQNADVTTTNTDISEEQWITCLRQRTREQRLLSARLQSEKFIVTDPEN